MGKGLLIRVLSLNEKPLTQPINGVFDENGGSIGRADSNTMTLPDTERLISRLHARVTWEQGAYWLEDVGKGVSSLVNGHPISGEGRVRLSERDELRIGGYRLVVDRLDADAANLLRQKTISQQRPRTRPDPARLVEEHAQGRADTRPFPPAAPFGGLLGEAAAGQRAASGPFDDLLGKGPASLPTTASPVDPFADLLAPGNGAAAPALPSGVPAASAPFADLLGAVGAPRSSAQAAPGQGPDPFADLMRSPASAPEPGRLPDDFDPFADPGAHFPAPRPAEDPMRMIGDPLAEPGALDKMFGLSPAPGAHGLDSFLAGTPAQGAGPSFDPLQSLGMQAGAAPDAAQLSASNHVAEINAAYVPPRIVEAPERSKPAPAPPAPAPVRASVPAAPAPRAQAQGDLWSAFLEGAGLAPDAAPPPSAQAMRNLGAMLNEFVGGTLQLIALRAAEKNQMRAAMTVIQARDNNPLKFSPSAQAALAQLLQAPAQGFMSGPAAARAAMNDLRSHQIGTVAGTRAALEGVLARFEPRVLERRLARGGALETLVPAIRRARLWELYLEHFGKVQAEAEEDFYLLFAKAFLEAYEKQVERLGPAQKDGNP